MAKRMTLEEFVNKANKVHNNKYDYSESVYVNGTTKIVIICSEHGKFEQKPYIHLQGQGCPVCAHARRQKTCLQKYGCAVPMITDESREKAKKTVREKYGVDHITQVESVREKIRQSNLDRYGVENPMQNPDIVEKAKKTNIERYGVPCTMQNEDVKTKHRASVKVHYGTENSMQVKEVREKAKQTWIEKYGVDNPRKSAEIDDKIRKTCEEKYGVPYAIMSEESRAKILQSFIYNYGVDNPMKSPEIVEKTRVTNLERYGFENPSQSPEIQQKVKGSFQKRFGVSHAMKDPVILEKVLNTKRINGTFNTSYIEECLYSQLCLQFGESNVKRQYSSELYPYLCDFYIVSRDLYIELNASWTHGRHWYDENIDENIIFDFQSKAVNSKYYENALTVLTQRDVKKRDTARKNGLNYVVFWDFKLRDADLWFAMDCPDGQDWDREYSWIEKRDLRRPVQTPVLSGTVRSLTAVAKYYQFNVFYKQEIDKWTKNDFRQGLPLQIKLYHNRYKSNCIIIVTNILAKHLQS